METISPQNFGERMKPNESTPIAEYAAIIVTFVAYANYASGQERKYVKDVAYAKATTIAMFMYGAVFAGGTAWMFSNDYILPAWGGVLVSIFCLWVMFSNSIASHGFMKSLNEWAETRKDAEEKLFGYAISIVIDSE